MRWALGIFLTVCSGMANAQITVNRSIIEFTEGNRIEDVEVFNTGNHRIYLDIQASEVLSPESETPERVELRDPRSAPIIASPRQLMVPPGQRKRVRLILREPATRTDRVFRVAIKPYTGQVSIPDPGGDKKSSAIKVMVGYELLVFSRPPEFNADVAVTRTDNRITFVNRGNTNVLLRRIEQCDASGEDCESMQPNRLYAGETYVVDLPMSGRASEYPVSVWQSLGLENQKTTY